MIDIFVKELETGFTFQFPMPPDSIKLQAAAKFISYDIMSSGESKYPLGEELTGISWDGLFPGEARKDAPYVRAWTPPNECQGRLSMWKHYGRKLLLTISGTPVNHPMYLEQYQCEYSGGCGDIAYSLTFVSAKDIIVSTEGASTTNPSGAKTTTPAAAKPATAKTYTVKSGDSLWKIAQQKLGSGARWTEIYNLNKAAIDARNKGKRVDYTTIYPGQVFNLPA